MDKEFEGNLVKLVGLRKGERLTNKTSQALAEGEIPAFNMSSKASFFADTEMEGSELPKDLIVGKPEIAESDAVAIPDGNPIP